MQVKDYYQTLGILPTASADDIKTAYRKLALQFHPDTNNDDLYAAARFNEIKEAYEILVHPGRRQQYHEQRWLLLSEGRHFDPAIPLTPPNLLKQCLAFEQYLHHFNPHRGNPKEAALQLEQLFSPERVQLLLQFNDVFVNRELVASGMRCASLIPLAQWPRLEERLLQLLGQDLLMGDAVRLHFKQLARRRWSRYTGWLAFLLALLLLLFIFLVTKES
jgi:molecular chaperone DnaJ